MEGRPSREAIRFTDEGFRVGGYRLADGHLVLHPPQYVENLP